MSHTKRELAGVEAEIQRRGDHADEILTKADGEERDPTEDESAEVQKELKAIRGLKDRKAELEDLVKVQDEAKERGKGLEIADDAEVKLVDRSDSEVKSLGDQFIESKGYKSLIEGGMTGGNWSSGPIELKATLASTPGTALTPREYQPGIVQTLFQRNYVSDLLGQVQTNASQITYVKESTATNAAAAVAEATAKPQSTLAFTETTESVRKIATILPVTDELLADAPQIQAYVNSRLILFVKNTEEAQVLLGSGTAPNIQGIIGAGRNTVGTYARGTVDDNALAIFKAANGTRGSSQLDPDALVIHPTNWQAIRTAKDNNGQYMGGGPWYGPYGGPQGPAGASQFSADSIWGMRVVVTSNITVGSALLGAFGMGGAVYRRSGVTVEATNSHSTWFADDIVALRAEERLALAIYRESAFTVVTGLN